MHEILFYSLFCFTVDVFTVVAFVVDAFPNCKLDKEVCWAHGAFVSDATDNRWSTLFELFLAFGFRRSLAWSRTNPGHRCTEEQFNLRVRHSALLNQDIMLTSEDWI